MKIYRTATDLAPAGETDPRPAAFGNYCAEKYDRRAHFPHENIGNNAFKSIGSIYGYSVGIALGIGAEIFQDPYGVIRVADIRTT